MFEKIAQYYRLLTHPISVLSYLIAMLWAKGLFWILSHLIKASWTLKVYEILKIAIANTAEFLLYYTIFSVAEAIFAVCLKNAIRKMKKRFSLFSK